jgi:hypothetical protein
MTAEVGAAVLTARRAAQHIRLFESNDAYECLCILTVLPEPSPISALCWQIQRRLAVLMPLLRVWVHCPRASNGLLPRRSNLVGYAQWDARFGRFLLCQTIMSSSFSGRNQPGFSGTSCGSDLRTSREMSGRPGWPRRTFQVQNKRKPARCQAMTVFGLTMASAERQSLQTRDSQTHNKRSPEVNFGRFSCGSPKHTDLVAQSQVLKLESSARTEERRQNLRAVA